MRYSEMTDEERERYDEEDARADRREARAIELEETRIVSTVATVTVGGPLEDLRRLGGRYEFMTDEELQAILDYEDEIELEESGDEYTSLKTNSSDLVGVFPTHNDFPES